MGRGKLEVVYQPLRIDGFALECEYHLRGAVGLQQVEGFIECIGLVVAAGVDLVADGLSGRDIDGGVAHRVDTGIFVD